MARAQFKSGKSFNDTKPQIGGQRGPMASDLVDMLEWPKKGKSATVRLAGPVAARGVHKVKVNKRDGTKTEITKTCLAFNNETEEKDSTIKCPYCLLDSDLSRFSKIYFANGIVRELQEEKPTKLKKPTASEVKTGFKDVNSDTWTPFRVLRVPSSLALRISQLGDKNKVKGKDGTPKAFPMNHPKFGRDMEMSFDASLPPANMYSADPTEGPDGEKFSPLNEDELDYLMYDMDPLYPTESLDEAKKEAKSLAERFGKVAKDEDSDDDDDDEPPAKKSKSKKPSDDDDEEASDDDDEEMDFDEDDDEPPAKKSKASAKKPADDEEDEESGDDDDEELDDDEDTPPAKKSKAAALKTKAKKAPVDDDEDEDSEDEDLDEQGLDDDDEEPPAKKSKPKSKKPPVDDDEDDDSLDDLDEEEEDEPPAKKSKVTSKKSRS